MDLPSHKSVYATFDIDQLITMAHRHGKPIGAYAEALLDTPLPWTKMRQRYRLLGLVNKWGRDEVNLACERAMSVEAIDVNLISRMIECASEEREDETPPPPNVIPGRFFRDPSEFSATKVVGR